MSTSGAVAFLERVESDEAFAERLQAVQEDPAATYQVVLDAGFDATPEEIKAAFLERYGSELTPEQLDAVAGGMDGTMIAVYTVSAVFFAAQVAAAFV